MFKFRLLIALSVGAFFVWSSGAHTEGKDGKPAYAPAQAAPSQEAVSAAGAKAAAAVSADPSATSSTLPANTKIPSHYWIQIQRYNIKNNGKKENPISNVRIAVTFPNKQELILPEGNQYWPIGNGQVQEINRTFELPAQYVQNDAFKFRIQMQNKGNPMLPCDFDIVQISQFNRAYVCSVDLGWQKTHGVKDEDLDEEAIQIRVFTDLNSDKKEVPQDAIALK